MKRFDPSFNKAESFLDSLMNMIDQVKRATSQKVNSGHLQKDLNIDNNASNMQSSSDGGGVDQRCKCFHIQCMIELVGTLKK